MLPVALKRLETGFFKRTTAIVPQRIGRKYGNKQGFQHGDGAVCGGSFHSATIAVT